MGSNRLLQFWLSPYLVATEYFWVVLAIAYYGFGINISLYPYSSYFVILFMFMSRSLILIGTWSLT